MPFEAKNVAGDQKAREELMARTGRLAVPVIVVGDDVEGSLVLDTKGKVRSRSRA